MGYSHVVHGVGTGENGVCDGLWSGCSDEASRCVLPFETGCSLVVAVAPVGTGDTLPRDGDRDLYLKLTLGSRRTVDPALGRAFFLRGSDSAALMLALRFERLLELSPSAIVFCSSCLTLRGVGGGGERLGDGDAGREGSRGLDSELCSSISSSAALEPDAQSTSGRKGPSCGESTLGELGSSAAVDALVTLNGQSLTYGA